MKLAVFGTGGVGGLFGARLAQSGNDVHFIARGAHLEAIRKNGLKVESELCGDVLIKPAQATNNASEIGPVDIVLFTVKLWDTESAATMARPLLGKDTAVISLQNGVVRDQILKEALGAEHVMGGISYVSATIEAPGVIVQKGTAQKLIFGEYGDNSRSPRAVRFEEACKKARIDCEIPQDIELALWEKYVVLVGMSTVLAAARRSIGPVRENPQTRGLLQAVMTEVYSVALKRGINLDKNLVEKKMSYLDNAAPDVTASMEYDLRNGNRLELPWLAGAVVEMGKTLAVPTPACSVLSAILSPYVMGSK